LDELLPGEEMKFPSIIFIFDAPVKFRFGGLLLILIVLFGETA